MRTSLAGLVCGVAVAVCVPGMGGCEGGLGKMFEQDAMAALSPLLRDAANSYIANLKKVAAELAGVRSISDAMAVAPKVESGARDVRKAYDTVSAATPQERELLWRAMGPQIEGANSDFVSQATRVRAESVWGRALSAGLDQVKLLTK